jgi:hypothetical protein
VGDRQKLGFREARGLILDSLRDRNFGHWPRKDAPLKNWLQYERITPEEVIELLLGCRGDQHSASPCHFDPATTAHEFLVEKEGHRWYVKAYWDDDLEQTVFMSVHPS